jgi:hypothetical protein
MCGLMLVVGSFQPPSQDLAKCPSIASSPKNQVKTVGLLVNQ